MDGFAETIGCLLTAMLFAVCVTPVMVVLKLVGVLDLSWGWTFSPMVPFVIGMAFYLLVETGHAIAWDARQRLKRRAAEKEAADA